MQTYIIRRFLIIIPLLIAISLISFLVMQLAPGNFLDTMKMNPNIPKEHIEQLEEDFGLNKSVPEQYLHWLWRALHLDFGRSFKYRVPVTHLIQTRIFNTLILSFSSMIFAWMLAIPIGIYSATHKYKFSDNALTVFALLGISIPNFFFALLIQFFIVRMGIDHPITGLTSIDYEWMTTSQKILDIARHLVVPTIVLGTAQMAGIMRRMRGQMLDAMRQDYVRTARAKGVKERFVIYKHALRNAINPLITIWGFQLGFVLSGAALTETVLGYPGMGRMMLEAVLSKDYYLAMAGLLMGSALLVIGNLIADVLLALVDPRIRYS
ncbi:MAG: ABC transporter permease [Halanaerobiales bacterium]